MQLADHARARGSASRIRYLRVELADRGSVKGCALNLEKSDTQAIARHLPSRELALHGQEQEQQTTVTCNAAT